MKLLAKLTGGRPMRYEGYAFTDRVAGYAVNYYTDRLGREWLAENAWSLFRVPMPVPKKVRDALIRAGVANGAPK